MGMEAGTNRSMGKKLTFRRVKNGAGVRLLAWLLLMAAADGGVLFAQWGGVPANSSGQAHPMAVGDGTGGSALYGAGQQQAPAPIVRGDQSGGVIDEAAGQMKAGGGQTGPNRLRGGDHLAQWMKRHSGMTLEQEQQALNQLPGFNLLSPQAQYRLHKRLAQLYAMQPLQRQRTLDHIEAMEQLTPGERSQVRGALEQLGALPPAQRRQVIRIFRQLRQLPPGQRWRAVNAPRFDWMPDDERIVLTNLVRVSPLLPPQ